MQTEWKYVINVGNDMVVDCMRVRGSGENERDTVGLGASDANLVN